MLTHPHGARHHAFDVGSRPHLASPPGRRPDPVSGPGGLAPWQVRRVAAYIETRLAERITCRDLAELARLSVGHFSRVFAVSFGQSPHTYILGRRMDHAKLLMTTTSSTLGQIALDCGMSDQSHFCRTFQRMVGHAPSTWRREDGLADRAAPAP